MKRIGVIALLCLIALPFGLDARQDELREGYINATSCDTLPSPLSVDVRLADNSDDYIRLRNVLVRRLERIGIAVVGDAPVMLSVELEHMSRAPVFKQRDLGEFSDGTGQRTRFRMNVWSSRADSIIGGRHDRIMSEGIDRLRIALFFNNRHDGRCLWQGEAVHNLEGGNVRHVADRMIPALVDAIGTSATRTPFYAD